MNKFKLNSKFTPIDDQKKAIEKLSNGVLHGLDKQVLLGVTGSGKTFTIANVINRLQRPTLIISHNKTLAAQLYQEIRDFFPDNAVSYFVSYYDYYQPEAYIPSTDTYIEKDADINEMIDKLRLSATANLLTRKDTIIIASVSCIYNIGSPIEYGKFVFEMKDAMKIERNQIIERLIDLQYERSDFGFERGTFRVRGDYIDIYPAYQDEGVRIEVFGNKIKSIELINTITGETLKPDFGNFVLYPAKHFMTDPTKNSEAFKAIENDLVKRVSELEKENKLVEAQRLKQKVNYDMEMIKEVGYVKGIENYSRYFDGRNSGDTPYSLLDFFNIPYNKDWLVVVDESHITFPQVRGMYAGDQSRKKTLIDYGFRLPSAVDNRPLTFDEFLRKIPNFIATSATPGDWELSQAKESYSKVSNPKSKKDIAKEGLTEQLIRPTGIPDPVVEIKPVNNQVKDAIEEIKKRAKLGQRTLVTTLTKQTAEDLANFLKEKGIKVHYLHSDVKTLERSDILDDLRKGNYDCLVGINLLREGLDLPEVSLVCILDADKEGFLRSDVTLIQTMGRAARHAEGKVIMYADKITGSMKRALDEVERRRIYQLDMNEKLGIVPKTIVKPIREKLIDEEEKDTRSWSILESKAKISILPDFDTESLTPKEKSKLLRKLKFEMKEAASNLNFEFAIEIRDKIRQLES